MLSQLRTHEHNAMRASLNGEYDQPDRIDLVGLTASS